MKDKMENKPQYTQERTFQFEKHFFHDDSLDESLLAGALEVVEDPLKRYSNSRFQKDVYPKTDVGIQPVLNLGYLVALDGDYHAHRHPMLKDTAVVSYRKSEDGAVRTVYVKINDEQMQKFLERDKSADFDFRFKVPMLKEI